MATRKELLQQIVQKFAEYDKLAAQYPSISAGLSEANKKNLDVVRTKLAPILKPATPATPAEPVAPAKAITGSVGEKGDNKAEDVVTVKNLLNKFGAGLDPANTNCGPKTIEAIKHFQQTKAGLANPDGLISPNGKTWKALTGGATAPAETPKTEPNAGGGGSLEKPNWVAIAEKEIGVAEKVGSQHHPRIIEYHATTGGFKDDETPWCSSFVNWVMKQAGKSPTGSAMALSWAKWGQETQGNKPAYGSVCVKTRKGGGHVGIVVGKKGSKILVLGGNQGDKCCVVAYNPTDFFTYRFPSGYVAPASAYILNEGTDSGAGGKES